MVYLDRILRKWRLDLLDYFLISAYIGSLVASLLKELKEYYSEKAAMKRLKSSMINESRLSATKKKAPILKNQDYKDSKIQKIRKIHRFVLGHRGGQFEEFEADQGFKTAQKIQQMVEQLAAFLKERELKGFLKIFFIGGRLILELVLFKCNINISYSILTDGLSTQVIVFTATVGGAIGFTLSWFSVGAALVSPPLILSTLLLRSLTQQILNQREYLKFKKLVTEMLNEDDIKETLRAVFLEGEGPASRIEMGLPDLDKNPTLQHDFNGQSSEDLQEFIKERVKNELGLIENPTEAELEQIIKRNTRPKGKTVFFRDYDLDLDISDSDISDVSEIIDAEILEKSIRIRIDNEDNEF